MKKTLKMSTVLKKHGFSTVNTKEKHGFANTVNQCTKNIVAKPLPQIKHG